MTAPARDANPTGVIGRLSASMTVLDSASVEGGGFIELPQKGARFNLEQPRGQAYKKKASQAAHYQDS